MLDDFFYRALIAGIGIAIVAGPIGCFMIWRRLAYFGDTLAHGALLGVAAGLLLDINVILSVFVVSSVIAIFLLGLQKSTRISPDALLGLLSHSALAIGLLVVALFGTLRIDLLGVLFGDILAVSRSELLIIYVGGALVLAILAYIWKPLFAVTVDMDLATAEGINGDRINFVFTLLVAGVIAISLKIVGVLLITAMLIIPAAAARSLASSPERMALIAVLVGIASVVGGLNASLSFDTPSGPSIVVACLALFVLSQLPFGLLRMKSDQINSGEAR